MKATTPIWFGTSRTDSAPTFLGRYDMGSLATMLLSNRQRDKGAYFMPVSFFGGIGLRRSDAVESVHALVIDIDSGYALEDCLIHLRKSVIPCIVLTTHSHQVAKGDHDACDRYRIIAPFSSPVAGDIWKELYPRLAAAVSGSLAFDQATCDPIRIWFFPPLDTKLTILNEDRELLDPFALLAGLAVPEREEVLTERHGDLELSVSGGAWKAFDDNCTVDELADILIGIGFHSPRHVLVRGSRSIQLVRPGKKASDGISVSINEKNGAYLTNFSTSIPEFSDMKKGYSAFETIKRLLFKGDRAAACKWAEEWCAIKSIPKGRAK